MSIRPFDSDSIAVAMERCGIEVWGAFTVGPESIGWSSLQRRYFECTVVCIAMPYSVEQARYQGRRRDDGVLAYIEAFAWNTDYHRDVKALLGRFDETIRSIDARFDLPGDVMVDNSGLDDREIALRAGIGLLGRNNLLINERYGTRFFIGYVVYPRRIGDSDGERAASAVTGDAPIWSFREPPDERFRLPLCKTCGLCVARCPTAALESDMSRCISHLTQTKDEVPESLMPFFENQLYGCSICQQVCPMNRRKEWSGDSYIDPREILTISSKRFKEKYGRMGYAWRPLWVYRRNALIVLGNLGGEAELAWLETLDFSKDEKLAAVAEVTRKRLRNRVLKSDGECYNE